MQEQVEPKPDQRLTASREGAGGGRQYRRRALLAALGALAAAAAVRTAPAQAGPVLVFAAASLKNALDAVARQYAAHTRRPATISYAATSALAKQIENGAPADLFISADERWMDYLLERDLVDAKTRHDLLGNRLVLIAPKDSPFQQAPIAAGFPLPKMLDGGHLAMAEPNSVPAGRYGKAALTRLGLWEAVAGLVAAAENVRAALLLVARGEAALGIVYRTDAAIEPGVKIIGLFPPETHPPIVYPMALTKIARPDARAFASYLRGPAARALFEAQGFIVLDQPR